VSIESWSPWHPEVCAGAALLRQHHEEVVARDVRVEVDAAGVRFDPFACSRRRLSARGVDLAVDLRQPARLLARRRRRVEPEDGPAATEVGRERLPARLAAAVELLGDEPGERERPMLDNGRDRLDRVGTLPARGLVRDVERALHVRLERETVARRGD